MAKSLIEQMAEDVKGKKSRLHAHVEYSKPSDKREFDESKIEFECEGITVGDVWKHNTVKLNDGSDRLEKVVVIRSSCRFSSIYTFNESGDLRTYLTLEFLKYFTKYSD